jgi:glycosyltransferase involved in cell wall biosynthesis
MLLPISESLAKVLPKHRIHVAGEFQDLRYKLLFDEYIKAVDSAQNISFDGYQKNVSGWLEDKKYVLNTSLFESFNYGVAEGMLCGAIPLVRNWFGSGNVWPDVKRWNTIDELTGAIVSYESMEQKDLIAEQERNRQFVIDTYGFDKIIPQIERLIDA